MGTGIDIKKKIEVQEESVTITSDVNSINFVGAGVTASTSGDDVTVNIPGSIGATVYYLNETITQAPYKEFSSISTAAAEQTIATAIGVGATVTIQSFQTPSGVPNTTNIPAGLWQFYLHFSGTAGNSWDVYAEVYKRDLGGIETLLLTTDIIPTTALSVIPTMILTDGVFPASTVLTTDRIVVKVKATNTGVAGQTITFHTEGSTNYSVGTTTLNQIVPTGAVTNVTGTAPIASSGGTTPAISISQADAVNDGYLSSTDWNTFNNKQDTISLTTTGTSGAATLIANTLNIPQYSFTDTNIYNTDGTLTGNRIVTMNANTLLFDGTDSDIRYTPNSVGGYLQLEGKASGVPRFGISVPAFGANPAAGFQMGMRAWDDATFVGYGQVGDAFFYAGNATYGLNFLNPPGVGTADYIRFYAGIDATGTSHMHIQGTGATKGYIGIGTETPTEKLDVAGKTRTTTFQMTTSPTAGYVMTSDASGNGAWAAAGTGGLTYFTEAQNTAVPNATVPVDSLTAIAGTTNADVAIVPKGTGAFMLDIPDNAATGGNKRGSNAIDLQTSRTNANQVASGNNSIVIGVNSIASANQAIAIGTGASATNSGIALNSNGNITGSPATASGIGSFAVNGGAASGLWSFSMGRAVSNNTNAFSFGGYYTSVTASGDASIAMSEGNTASGNYSLAIGGNSNIASGTAAVALGQQNTASGGNSVAIGKSNNSTGTSAVTLGTGNTSVGYGSTTVGLSNSTAYDFNYAFGYANTLTSGPLGNNSNVFAFGAGNTVNAGFAIAIGCYGLTNGVTGRQTFSSGRIATNGDAQKSTFFYRGRTTDATLTTIATDGSNSINASNCMQLANNSSIRFKGTISGKQSGSTNIAAWDVDGLIVRGASAAATTLTVGNVNLVSNIPGWGTPVLSAYVDAFNGVGALKIQIQGAAATNIQWTAVIETTEVIYA